MECPPRLVRQWLHRSYTGPAWPRLHRPRLAAVTPAPPGRGYTGPAWPRLHRPRLAAGCWARQNAQSESQV